jgi:hypothetical protein
MGGKFRDRSRGAMQDTPEVSSVVAVSGHPRANRRRTLNRADSVSNSRQALRRSSENISSENRHPTFLDHLTDGFAPAQHSRSIPQLISTAQAEAAPHMLRKAAGVQAIRSVSNLAGCSKSWLR